MPRAGYAADVSHHRGLAAMPAEDRGAATELLLRAAQTASGSDRSRLLARVVLLNLELAESVMRRYQGHGIDHEDLLQVAYLGLVKAARRFDPGRGSGFVGYAVPTIRGELRRYFRDNAWTVRPPRRLQELQARISGARSELTQVAGREVGAGELADVMDEPAAAVREALAAGGCFTAASLDRIAADDNGGGPLGHQEPDYDRIEARVSLRPLVAELSERDRQILYLRFFLEWTQSRIASQFGVSQMQVSRLLSRILARLRTELEGRPRSTRAPQSARRQPPAGAALDHYPAAS
ncbi:MAG TPA: sigma-70 family RNA polymerase sigma factor [Nocardioidaceae bacterium]|nr:sigma-70 family RNA polymerase sigma factor [Nocardioidaceae bacterium]